MRSIARRIRTLIYLSRSKSFRDPHAQNRFEIPGSKSRILHLQRFTIAPSKFITPARAEAAKGGKAVVAAAVEAVEAQTALLLKLAAVLLALFFHRALLHVYNDIFLGLMP